MRNLQSEFGNTGCIVKHVGLQLGCTCTKRNDVVVVLFYDHVKQIWSCRDGQLP